MAIVKTMGRARTITVQNHGDQFSLGDTSDESMAGAWQVMFVPAVNAQWSVAVLGSNAGYLPDSANAPFMPVPYRQITINNVAQDYSYSSAIIASPSLILIPANALTVALLFACTNGSVDVYSVPITGPTAP